MEGARGLAMVGVDQSWWTPEAALLWTWVVTVGIQGTCFLIAASCKFDKITDFAGSMNFIIIAVMSLVIGEHFSARNLLLVAYVVVSRLELAIFLLMRVLKRGKDDRFDEVREHFCRFFAFWAFQAIWAWSVTAPVVLSCAAPADAPLGAADFVGLALFVAGMLIQFVADYQKSQFRANKDNKGRICDVCVPRPPAPRAARGGPFSDLVRVCTRAAAAAVAAVAAAGAGASGAGAGTRTTGARS